ncbi:MAG: hypothetical protein QOI93_5123 [Rhodospirillaceae bacterium]|nr:hypothetical protein [Rhodospirillaceae bacterium]
MALIGHGVLAIWNGIKPEAEDDFVAWHVREHIPERVGLPGFLRGRRYVAVEGHPKYFNFYETETAAALSSVAYQARLNAPTDWTRRVVAHFTDTSRTICDVAWSVGVGEGGWIEAIVLETATTAETFQAAIRARLGDAITAIPGIVGMHLLKGQLAAAQGDTVEKKLRGVPDKMAAWILLVEAVGSEALGAFRSQTGSDQAMIDCGAGATILRGTYQLQFALTKAELAKS